MNKGKYPCKIAQHNHLSKSKRDKCVTASKFHKMRNDALLKKYNDSKSTPTNNVKVQEQSQVKIAQEEQQEDDFALLENGQTVYKFIPTNKSLLKGKEKYISLNWNEMLVDFKEIAARREAKRFWQLVKSNKIEEEYLQLTDNDKQWTWTPSSKFKNWKNSVIDNQHVKDTQKPYSGRFLKQSDKELLTFKKVDNNRKQRLGMILENNPGLLVFYDQQALMKRLPTQIPIINMTYREKQRAKYDKLYQIIESLYLQIQIPRDDANNQWIRRSLCYLYRDVQNLLGLLKFNIFDSRYETGFHFKETKYWAEKQIVDIWLVIKEYPMPEKLLINDQGLRFLTNWMEQAIPKYTKDINEIQPIEQEKKSTNKKKDDLRRQLFQYPIQIVPKIEKYYKNWDQLAHELGKNYREQQNKLECSSIISASTRHCTMKVKEHTQILQPNTQVFKEYRLQREEKYLQDCQRFKKQCFYTRSYFRNSHKVFYISPAKEIRLYEKVYELFSHIDPICVRCKSQMKVLSPSQFIDFQCKCGKRLQKKFEKLRECENFKTVIELKGKQMTIFYPSILSSTRNNFHQFNFKWMRRAKYSQEIPFKLKTSLPIFSGQTNLQIQQNREMENYLPLEIRESIIPEAGKGMFTKQFIKKGSLILTYVGVIKAHYEIQSDNNSIFSIGIINTHDNMAVMIDPLEQGNAGKYINASYGMNVNCKAEIGIFKPRAPDLPEPAVIFIATKDIQPGYELFYEYGGNYWKPINKKKYKK